jgi:hypothetical protein
MQYHHHPIREFKCNNQSPSIIPQMPTTFLLQQSTPTIPKPQALIISRSNQSTHPTTFHLLQNKTDIMFLLNHLSWTIFKTSPSNSEIAGAVFRAG